MNKYAVAIYYYDKEQVEAVVVEAKTDAEAIQRAVGDNIVDPNATVRGCVNHYWESKKLLISAPVKI